MAKYYYGGVLLPEIPVIEGYPYTFIRKDETNGNYDLIYSIKKPCYNGTNIGYVTDGTIGQGDTHWYRIEIASASTSTVWVFNKSSATWFGLNNERTVMWSNVDIPIGSETSTDIYFYVSEPYRVLYLVKADGKLYTVVDDALSELTTTDIVAQTFLDYGIEDIPDGALLVGLSNPEVLCWQDREDDFPTLTATVIATPLHQIIMSQAIDLMHSSIKGINSITVNCKGDVLFAVSFDNKATWVKHNGTDWVAVSDELTGMTKLEFEAITTEQWQAKYELSSDMYIRCTLTDATQFVTSVNISFIN